MTPPPYKPHPPHRSGAPEKSQWTISEDDERECFARAWAQGWVDASGNVGWGVKADEGGIAQYLGVSADGARYLWWAKFVGKQSPWHGYPADIVRRQGGDCPAPNVVRAWLHAGHIDKAALSRITRRKPCRPS